MKAIVWITLLLFPCRVSAQKMDSIIFEGFGFQNIQRIKDSLEHQEKSFRNLMELKADSLDKQSRLTLHRQRIEQINRLCY